MYKQNIQNFKKLSLHLRMLNTTKVIVFPLTHVKMIKLSFQIKVHKYN